MNENTKAVTLTVTAETESKTAKIASIIAKLPPHEQENLYYYIKGVEHTLTVPAHTAPRPVAAV
jgi:hypothetical protein